VPKVLERKIFPPIPLSPASGGIFDLEWRGVHPEGFTLKGNKRREVEKGQKIALQKNRGNVKGERART